jgi:hypothetical protein
MISGTHRRFSTIAPLWLRTLSRSKRSEAMKLLRENPDSPLSVRVAIPRSSKPKIKTKARDVIVISDGLSVGLVEPSPYVGRHTARLSKSKSYGLS